MDNMTKDIVFKYLDKTFRITNQTLIDYRVKDFQYGEVPLIKVHTEIQNVFGLSRTESTELFNKWIDLSTTLYINDIADEQFDKYAKTGIIEEGMVDTNDMASRAESMTGWLPQWL